MEACKVCDGQSFKCEAGFYYCETCNTQGKMVQLHYDEYFGHVDNRLNKSKQIVEKAAAVEITSWEEHNYVLIGLVDELVELGAKPELKMATLQLWAAYLRALEVAFFAKKHPQLPKLNAYFKKKDARIIYNLKGTKRARSSRKSISSTDSKTTTQSAKSIKRDLRRQQISLVNAEYEMETATQGSMSVNQASSSSFSTKASTARSENTVRIEFARTAKRILKRRMPKKHVHKHEENGNLECHEFKRKLFRRDCYPEIVARGILYEILFLALNQCEDDIQLGDVIRYIREGHMTYHSVKKYLPANIAGLDMAENLFNKAATLQPSHAHTRYSAGKIMRMLKVHMKIPNMTKLCRRYITELCLPNDVHKMVETLLMVCPPEMKIKKNVKAKVPNYEGRAMAYIIYVLKLLYGLDNKRELRMSVSAQQINVHLGRLDPAKKPLFVWTDWVKYIEMRNVILAQCHFPTSVQFDTNSTKSNHLYVHYLKEQEEKRSTEILSPDIKLHLCIENMDTIFKKLCKLHETDQEKSSFKFLPSQTPKSYCINYLLNDRTMTTNIHIPSFMHNQQQFETADIVSFLKPSLLRAFFKQHNIKLHVNRLPCNDDVVYAYFFTGCYPKKRRNLALADKCVSYKFDVNDEQWKKSLALADLKELENAGLRSTEQCLLVADCLALIEKNDLNAIAAKKVRKAHIETETNAHDQTDMEERDEHIPLLDYDVTDEESDGDEVGESLQFDVSNYDYWMSLGYTKELRRDQFKLLQTTLPKHFNWLLRQCSQTIECSERDVYEELICIENQFAYVLEQFSNMSNIVTHQPAENYRHIPGLYKFIRTMQQDW